MRCLILLLLPLAAWAAETVPGPRHRQAGPWQIWNGTGLQIGVALVAPLDQGALDRLALEVDGRDSGLRPVQRAWRHEGGAGAVVEWTLPAAGLRPAPFAITAPGVRWGGTLAPPPRIDDPARLAVAGVAAWPRPEQLAALEGPLGGPVQGVLVLGGCGLAPVLGHGGWEERLPLVVLCSHGGGDPVRSALLGAVEGAFPHGLRWGVLGLPASAGFEGVATAIGQVGGEWQVFLQPQAGWDLSLLAAAERADSRPLTALMGLGAALRLPLVLAGGGYAGFVSEPLAIDTDGALAALPGGCRYAVASGAGGGLSSLPPLVAAPIDRPSAIGVAADDDHLVLAVVPEGAPAEARTWSWGPWAKDAPSPAGGWGGGEAKSTRDALAALFYAEGERTPAERARMLELAGVLIDIARPALRIAEPGRDGFQRLITGEGGAPPEPWRRRYALHLLADGDFRSSRVGSAAELPDWAQREAVLRALDDRHPLTAWWADVAATTADPLLVQAAVVFAERRPSPDTLGVLVERLRRQAAGTTAIDPDPLLQSRLAAAVFDSPYLSPTPLRPIAVALKDRLDPLGRGPLVRFLERRGTERP